jgi:CheY-like chemotaxis protein
LTLVGARAGCHGSPRLPNVLFPLYPWLVLLPKTILVFNQLIATRQHLLVAEEGMSASLHSDRPGIMVVMITAYGSIESAVAAMQESANDYLLKPFDPKQLMLLIEKMAGQKELMSDYRLVRALLSELEGAGFNNHSRIR